MKLTGSSAHAYLGIYDEDDIKTTGTTDPDTLYFILSMAKRENPADIGLLKGFSAGTFIKSPASGTQIDLKEGDRWAKIDKKRLSKTSADFSMEQGAVDVGDDLDPGAHILDGIVNISGSISGLFRYDEVSGNFDDVTEDIINRFLPVVKDNEKGVYERHARDDSRAFLLILLNSKVKDGQNENWLFVPVVFSSLNLPLANTDAQTRELSWSKGEGEAVLYRVEKKA